MNQSTINLINRYCENCTNLLIPSDKMRERIEEIIQELVDENNMVLLEKIINKSEYIYSKKIIDGMRFIITLKEEFNAANR
jgi:hypothetical protein